MYKKAISFVIAIPSLILLFVFRIIPAINSLMISTKDYNVVRGMSGSENVGLKNYVNIVQSAHFTRICRNTVTLSFLSILLTCVFAALLTVCIAKMPNRVIKTISIVLISVPAFIPIASYVAIITRVLSPGSGAIAGMLTSMGSESEFFLAKPQYFPIIFALAEAMRNVYIPVILGVLACEKKGVNAGRIFMAISLYALVRMTLFFSPDLETILLMYNPMIYERADVLDTYAFRSGMMQMQYSSASAVWVMKTIAQLFVNILIYIILTLIFPKIKDMARTLSDKVNRTGSAIISIFAFILLAAVPIGITAGIFFPSLLGKYAGNAGILYSLKLVFSNPVFISSFVNSFIYGIFSCLLFGVLTITLAYPLTTKPKIYPLFLVLVLTLTNNIAGEYIFFRSLGLFNNYLSIILQSGLTVFGAFALHFTVSSKFEDEVPAFSKYIKEAILPLLSIVALFFTANWGSYLYQQVLIINRQFFGNSLIIREFLLQTPDAKNTQLAESLQSAVILLSSIIPAIIGTLVICLNRFLPLSALSSQARKG